MFAEIQYSGVMGEHLQTELLDYNQINPSYLTKFGTVAQSITVLNSQITSATGKASGVPLPYPTFTGTPGSERPETADARYKAVDPEAFASERADGPPRERGPKGGTAAPGSVGP